MKSSNHTRTEVHSAWFHFEFARASGAKVCTKGKRLPAPQEVQRVAMHMKALQHVGKSNAAHERSAIGVIGPVVRVEINRYRGTAGTYIRLHTQQQVVSPTCCKAIALSEMCERSDELASAFFVRHGGSRLSEKASMRPASSNCAAMKALERTVDTVGPVIDASPTKQMKHLGGPP